MPEGLNEGDLTEPPRKTQNCGEQRLPPAESLLVVALLPCCARLGWLGLGWASQAKLSCRAGYDWEAGGDIYITDSHSEGEGLS